MAFPNTLFSTKSTNAEEFIKHFTSHSFKKFCTAKNIDHIETTASVPRGNGQIERVNRVIISVLSKMSASEPAKWYKYTSQVQQAT